MIGPVPSDRHLNNLNSEPWVEVSTLSSSRLFINKDQVFTTTHNYCRHQASHHKTRSSGSSYETRRRVDALMDSVDSRWDDGMDCDCKWDVAYSERVARRPSTPPSRVLFRERERASVLCRRR